MTAPPEAGQLGDARVGSAHRDTGEHIDVPALGQSDRPPTAVSRPSEGGGGARLGGQIQAAVEQGGRDLRGVHPYLQAGPAGVGPGRGEATVERLAPLGDQLEAGGDPVPRRTVEGQDATVGARASDGLERVGQGRFRYPGCLLER